MKKFLKRMLCIAVVAVLGIGLTACGKVSETTANYSKTLYNEKTTNGGITLIHDGYLYFINGTKTNDGTSATKNTKSAICRVKIDSEGKVDTNSYEVVLDNLVGYENGSLSIFGDYLYFATPSDDVNYAGTKLNYQTKFMRYDMVNKKSYTIYTTKQNSSSEIVSSAFYIVGNDLYLVVYEKTNKTLTSVKVAEKPSTQYVVSDVTSCVFSENYGKSVTKDANSNEVVDANNYVFYTKASDVYEDGFSSGNKTYKVSPVTNNESVCISNVGKTVSLLSIRNGKLVYSAKSIDSDKTIIYTQSITNSTNELLFEDVISYQSYDNVIFVEDGDSIYSVCMDSSTKEITILKVNADNKLQVDPEIINTLNVSSSSDDSSKVDMAFVDIVTLTESVKKNTEEQATSENTENTETAEQEETEEVTYLVYITSNTVYKLAIMRNGEVSKLEEPIKLSKSSVSAPSGNLVPEIVGNYLYIFAEAVDSAGKTTSKVYLHRIDLTVLEDSTEFAEEISIKE